MKYLTLRFSGVLQYYSSKTNTTLKQNYPTDFYPTRNAIIGLIGSAMGINREDFNDFRANLESKISTKYKSLSTKASILEDFQTVRPLKSQQYYMNKQNNRNSFFSVEGKQKNTPIIKNIQYLQDADFEVYVGSEDEQLLKDIYDAIRNPVYALYFGKRSCVPNKPIVTEFILTDSVEGYAC